MQIVIDIKDDDYYDIIGDALVGESTMREIINAIKDGTPLHPNGNWTRRYYIYGDKTLDMCVCSCCGEEFSYDAETGANIYDYDYCPNCGNYKRNKAEGDIE